MANDNSIFESQPAKKSKTATKDATENGPKSTRCKTRSRTLKKNQTEQDFPIEGSQSTPEKLSSPDKNGVASSTEEINGNTESMAMDNNLKVVSTPTELAEVTDPFTLHKMGYEFMIAATKQLQQEKKAIENNYENIIKSLKEKFESLEESSVKQIEKLREELKKQSEAILKVKEEAANNEECLQKKIKVLTDENKRLEAETERNREYIKKEDAKVAAIPKAVEFFLKSFLEDGKSAKVKRERTIVEEGEDDEEQGASSTLNSCDDINVFDRLAMQR